MDAVISFAKSIEWWTLISGAILGVVGIGLRAIIQAPVKSMTEQRRVISMLWWLSPQKPFRGLWKVAWAVQSNNYPVENVDCVRVRRLFSNVSFTTVAKLKDGSTQKCVFVGKLADRAVTGRWFNPEDEGRGYFGAFQFRVHGSLRRGDGIWIGWRNDGTVASDQLSLTKVD